MNIRATENKQRSGKELKYTWLYTYMYKIKNQGMDTYKVQRHGHIFLDKELLNQSDYNKILNLIKENLNIKHKTNYERYITLINWKKVIKDES